ncbi:alcohol dehydrogenase catalytic domain-containing protein [Microbacterium sp. zg.Y1090]|uniref:zinc-dependent alcohol dehydrogenase n=1 Tax=Microbacterium wangruii TaxID=3049073 RepID=UPI00214C0FF7|nr:MULTISPECIES: zinc-binding dehydrogenase [unclassified Microbacterium]MCR2817276.1 alcohol dehydrogenase catalytic domain-containing protein [Microbacterium sp. zg.Y1090]MDL5486058.1 alcohol dehydrogenase catalytic domain-containing protein [Microbacterium sp. zg-Y1211]WIM29235.1 alcohol dehydrogenase catalytic domain-containing protein [Microbacterium sp. zg-Y1090]
MKSVHVTGVNQIDWVEVDKPEVGPRDVLLRMRACGICGSDAMYASYGGIPPRQGATPLGHEPAAEVAEVGAEVEGFAVGDHVVIDTMRFTDGLLGSGGAQGGFTPYVVVRDATPGVQLKVIPDHVPWDVAALNEPMAVALHAVNRTGVKEGDKVVIFGAGPIGLGALLGYRRKGASHIVVVDVIPSRLEKALEIGADAVIDSSKEDVGARLVELHSDGATPWVRGVRPATDIYLDAAGVAVVPQTVTSIAKHGATLGIVAVHKKPVELDFGGILQTELNIVWAMGYPTEIFEVTDDIVENWEKYAKIISHRFPFEQTLEALELAATPGAADKVTVVFD